MVHVPTRFALRRTLIVAIGAAALLATGTGTASAATLPPGFAETQVATGLAAPTAMAFAPDGRLFVAEQGGRLRVIKSGALLSAPFVSLSVDSAGERGLLGVAFHPSFASNQYVYVYYTTATSPIHNRVSRFTAMGDVAVPGSEVVMLELDNLSTATNHNGGAIHFGPDGALYVAVGDNANGSNAQTLSNRLGKMLRINQDGTIPTTNPFYSTATGANRAIWALGFRNPFTFTFQPGSSRLFINDVGEATWEEIDDGIAGSNYGWPGSEGPTSDPRFRSPIYWYGHGAGPTTGCAISGGAFYNPPTVQFPTDYLGDYFFADFCSGWIRRFDPANSSVTDFAAGIASPVDLATAPDGSLYYLARGSGSGGSVFRVAYAPSQAGDGLRATYYDNRDLTGTTISRVDGTVDFVWGTGAPVTGIGADTFSVRWVGSVQAPASGTYTFYTESDDGVRLWVGGKQLVDNWTDHARTENSGTIALTAGVRYPVRMEFYENLGNAAARLLWSGPSISKAVVPRSALFSPFTAKINFQPASAAVPASYLADTGSVYDLRSTGERYGWTADNTAQTRDRDAANSPDQRYDTLTHLQKPANPNAVWEILVPNGTYTVRVVAGDPAFTDSVYRLNVEGVATVSGTPTSSTHWFEGTSTVTVTDGRLTVTNGSGASNNKICFLEIS
jgi:glucose/arabinose dehydrogenase